MKALLFLEFQVKCNGYGILVSPLTIVDAYSRFTQSSAVPFLPTTRDLGEQARSSAHGLQPRNGGEVGVVHEQDSHL